MKNSTLAKIQSVRLARSQRLQRQLNHLKDELKENEYGLNIRTFAEKSAKNEWDESKKQFYSNLLAETSNMQSIKSGLSKVQRQQENYQNLKEEIRIANDQVNESQLKVHEADASFKALLKKQEKLKILKSMIQRTS